MKCKCGGDLEFVYSEEDYYFCCRIDYYVCYNCGNTDQVRH